MLFDVMYIYVKETVTLCNLLYVKDWIGSDVVCLLSVHNRIDTGIK